MSSLIIGIGALLVIFLAVVVVVVCIVAAAGRKNRKHNSPVLTVYATLIAKRQDVAYYNQPGPNGAGYAGGNTNYYLTFQVQSGDRMELQAEGYAYGRLAEGDRGQLTFQGSRCLGFERM